MEIEEAMGYVGEALFNLRNSYPMDRRCRANEAFGHLLGHLKVKPKPTVIVFHEEEDWTELRDKAE